MCDCNFQVMGLTFVAAGVSIPDALSSMAVIKEGYGDMAVSNAVGSNVFDILICLGLPWLIQTTIIDAGGHVNVISKGMRAPNRIENRKPSAEHTKLPKSTFVRHRIDIFDNIVAIDRCVPAHVGAFERLEIGQASRYHLDGLVFPVHRTGIHV